MTSLERSSLNQERAPITQLEKKYVNLPGQMSRKALILTALLAATLMLFGCRRAPSAVEVIATAAVIDDASEQSPTQDGGASQATLQLDPASGGAGTQINISGQGWTPGEEVNFILADQGGRSDVLATHTVSADGTLAISLAYPNESRWNTPGNYFVLGYTPNHALEVTAAFVVAEGSTDGDDSADSGATATPAPISRGGGGGSSSGDSSSPSSGDASKGGVEPTATSVAVTGARITIDPSSGTANTEVLVTCIDFPANTRVNVHLAGLVQTRGGATSESPYVYASTTTNAQGGCRMIFPMPSTWPDGRPLQSGELTVMVATEDFGTRGTATFAYVAPVPTATPTSTHTATATSTATATNTATATHTATSTSTPTATNTPIPTATPTARPYVTIEPATGGAGTAVTVNCGGYPANAQLNVYLAGLVQTRGGSSQSPTAYASVTTNADGDCPAFSFAMPSTWPDGRPIETGELSVLLATSNFAVRASDTFDYVAAPTPVARAPYADVIPASGGAGSLVTVTGGGFPAGERINIHLGKFDGQIGGGVVITYGSGVSDSNGDFTVRFTLPATWPDGSTIESSKILIVAANPGMEIQASAVFDYIKSSGPLPVATSTSTHTPTSVATNTPTSAPTSTATNTPAPASAQNGWNASYWNNTSLSGSPVLNRVDSAINFNWESGSPAAAVTANNFSARWTRTVDLQAGVYVFAMTMDDGARVYVDDQLVIDEWRLGSERTVRTDAYLSAGSHTIRVEYFERSERALIKFELEGTNLGWRGEYFPNATLSGTPALVRTDPEINFFWETGSPGSAIPVDQFSARWTREINFAAGVYRFNALADDGIRIWIDQTMILDEWHDSRSETYSVDVSLPAGPHTVRVEYYENTLGARVRVYWEDRDSASAAAPTAPVPTATWTPVPPTPTFTPVPPTATPANDANTIKVFTVAISNGRDDAEQQGDGRIKHDSDELEMTLHDSGQQIIGLRYQNLPIPQGAVVVAAYIDFTAEAVTTSPTSLLFQGESVDSAARYERDNFNISYREQTGARIAWTNVPGWSNVGQASRSPNLAAILQEIVNRPGWRPGNAVSFIISGEGLRIAESYDGNPGGAARLTVEFR